MVKDDVERIKYKDAMQLTLFKYEYTELKEKYDNFIMEIGHTYIPDWHNSDTSENNWREFLNECEELIYEYTELINHHSKSIGLVF